MRGSRPSTQAVDVRSSQSCRRWNNAHLLATRMPFSIFPDTMLTLIVVNGTCRGYPGDPDVHARHADTGGCAAGTSIRRSRRRCELFEPRAAIVVEPRR